MKNKTAIIIADTGFSEGALSGVKNLLGYYDLAERRVVMGRLNGADWNDDLEAFAVDSGHGSMVLQAALAVAPDRPYILIRSHNPDEGLVLTRWQDGRRVADGWVEAYLWAVNLAKLNGLTSVANFSFGAVRHAADSTGWDAFQLARVLGRGKPGHVAVAAAGGGTLSAEHASWQTLSGETTEVDVVQESTTSYNFWTAGRDTELNSSFQLRVERDGRLVHFEDSRKVPVNFWNGRKQITFTVSGACRVKLIVTRKSGLTGVDPADCKFDCWLLGKGGRFENHIDPTMIVEPAAFDHVIAAGFKHGHYSPDQNEPDAKPDVLIEGRGMISFNLPRLVAKVASILDEEPGLDVFQVKARLGKEPAL